MIQKSKRKIVIRLSEELYSNLQLIVIQKLTEIGVYKIIAQNKTINFILSDIIENELMVVGNENHLCLAFEAYFENNGDEFLLDLYNELIIK